MINENNKKVPCGGFYLGDGLIMDGNTLKSLGGEQVQSDYAQNDPTAKDYIKNRPGGYGERWEIAWDGDTTGRVSTTMEGAPGAWYKVSDKILTADDIIGGTITRIQNGVSQSLVIASDMIFRSDYGVAIGEPAIMISAKQGIFNMGDYNISIPEPGTYFVSASVDGYSMFVSSLSNITVRPFDDKYIPDTILRENKAYTNDERNVSITWDGNTDGKDTFNFNALPYYKLSDEVLPFKGVQSVSALTTTGRQENLLYEGTNCYNAGFAIVVTQAGTCKLALSQNSSTIITFTAPSAGIYFFYKNTGEYQTSLELSYLREQTGLIINSPNKQWAITVDDSGNISATQITK